MLPSFTTPAPYYVLKLVCCSRASVPRVLPLANVDMLQLTWLVQHFATANTVQFVK